MDLDTLIHEKSLLKKAQEHWSLLIAIVYVVSYLRIWFYYKLFFFDISGTISISDIVLPSFWTLVICFILFYLTLIFLSFAQKEQSKPIQGLDHLDRKAVLKVLITRLIVITVMILVSMILWSYDQVPEIYKWAMDETGNMDIRFSGIRNSLQYFGGLTVVFYGLYNSALRPNDIHKYLILISIFIVFLIIGVNETSNASSKIYKPDKDTYVKTTDSIVKSNSAFYYIGQSADFVYFFSVPDQKVYSYNMNSVAVIKE